MPGFMKDASTPSSACPVSSRTLPHDAVGRARGLRGFSYSFAYNMTGWAPSVIMRAGTRREERAGRRPDHSAAPPARMSSPATAPTSSGSSAKLQSSTIGRARSRCRGRPTVAFANRWQCRASAGLSGRRRRTRGTRLSRTSTDLLWAGIAARCRTAFVARGAIFGIRRHEIKRWWTWSCHASWPCSSRGRREVTAAVRGAAVLLMATMTDAAGSAASVLA